MTTTQIRCFLEAAKSLNFTYAASKLYISPSTLSKSILALEKELELQLFIRDRRGIRLTPGGALLCQRMTPFLDEMPNWIHQAQLANQGLNGTLRIGYLAPSTSIPTVPSTSPLLKKSIKTFMFPYSTKTSTACWASFVPTSWTLPSPPPLMCSSNMT